MIKGAIQIGRNEEAVVFIFLESFLNRLLLFGHDYYKNFSKVRGQPPKKICKEHLAIDVWIVYALLS